MGRIVVCGAGVGGLMTAMMLAAEGYDVTVVERDPAPPPEPSRAWDDWERRGVGQFRLPHFLLPAFREVMDAELPDVIPALVAGGASRFNLFGGMADTMDPDREYDVVTARRPLIEAVLAKAAAGTPAVEIRRGVAVAGVVTVGTGTPRVTGVFTDADEVVPADLVVDCGGRRSPMVRWLTEAGARPATVEEEDSGFVYYGRHVRAPEGVHLGGPGMVTNGSVALLVLPADDEVSGVGIIASSDDADLRVLRHEGPWTAAMALLPGGQPILDSDFVSPLVSMAAIEDRWRRFVVDGDPVATGVVSVGDAWAATNPTLGRGISLAARHARALRDVVRECGVDPDAVTRRFDEVTQEEFTPWYRSTVWHDRHRLRDLRTAREVDGGASAAVEDEEWTNFLRFQDGCRRDLPVLLPRMLRSIRLVERPEETIADPAVLARMDEIGAKVVPGEGPTRRELLAAIAH